MFPTSSGMFFFARLAVYDAHALRPPCLLLRDVGAVEDRLDRHAAVLLDLGHEVEVRRQQPREERQLRAPAAKELRAPVYAGRAGDKFPARS